MNRVQFILNTFGLATLKPKLYIPRVPLSAGVNKDYAIIEEERIFETMTGDAAQMSMLGTPVFSNVVLEIENINLKLRIDTVLCDARMNKQIVKTLIQGRNGTVKEYISDGDYSVKLMGALVSNVATEYPSSDMALMRRIVREAAAVKISSDYLNQFDIYNIVIENFAFPTKAGFQNMQAFELNCVSDEPIELVRK